MRHRALPGQAHHDQQREPPLSCTYRTTRALYRAFVVVDGRGSRIAGHMVRTAAFGHPSLLSNDLCGVVTCPPRVPKAVRFPCRPLGPRTAPKSGLCRPRRQVASRRPARPFRSGMDSRVCAFAHAPAPPWNAKGGAAPGSHKRSISLEGVAGLVPAPCRSRGSAVQLACGRDHLCNDLVHVCRFGAVIDETGAQREMPADGGV